MDESDSEVLYTELARALAPYGLAYLHVSENDTRGITKLLRAEWPGSLVLNPHPRGGDGAATVEEGTEALRSGLADAISFGRLWLANPDLHVRVAAGGPYNEADPATFYGGDRRGYTDYPMLATPAAP
jgi:N-ethylmaleimide reductase